MSDDRWADVDRLVTIERRITATLALHPAPLIDGGTCSGCGHPWPCPTRDMLLRGGRP